MTEKTYRDNISRLASAMIVEIKKYDGLPEGEKKSDFHYACIDAAPHLRRLAYEDAQANTVNEEIMNATFDKLGLTKRAASTLTKLGYQNINSLISDPEMSAYKLRSHIKGLSDKMSRHIIKIAKEAGRPLREK